jgi:GntR family transcriptional regulator
MTTIDRRSPLPLYVQLEQALLAHIRTAGLGPGDRFLTEVEIAKSYEVSRATIRQALARMVADGHLERIQGLGSFVAKPRPTHQPLLTSFTENMGSQGYTPCRKVLRSDTVSTPEDLQAALSWGALSQHVLRLFFADQTPVGISETWLPVDALAGRLDLFDPAALETGSLYSLLQGPAIGLQLHRGTETVRAGTVSAAQAELLSCDPGAPALVVRRVSYTPSDRPVESTVMTFAADRYEYRVDLFRPTG